jgi:hypothetical protein
MNYKGNESFVLHICAWKPCNFSIDQVGMVENAETEREPTASFNLGDHPKPPNKSQIKQYIQNGGPKDLEGFDAVGKIHLNYLNLLYCKGAYLLQCKIEGQFSVALLSMKFTVGETVYKFLLKPPLDFNTLTESEIYTIVDMLHSTFQQMGSLTRKGIVVAFCI